MAIARGFSNSIRAFFRTESSGGVFLLIAALIALIAANSPWSAGYLTFGISMNFYQRWLNSDIFLFGRPRNPPRGSVWSIS